MDPILSTTDGFFKSLRWSLYHPIRGVLFIWLVIMVPVYIAVTASSHMLLAGGLGAAFWVIPAVVFSVAHATRVERAIYPSWTLCLTGLLVLALASGPILIATFGLAGLSAYWGPPLSMPLGITAALLAWMLYFDLL